MPRPETLRGIGHQGPGLLLGPFADDERHPEEAHTRIFGDVDQAGGGTRPCSAQKFGYTTTLRLVNRSVDVCEQLPCLSSLVLLLPRTPQTHDGPQYQRLRPLMSRHGKSTLDCGAPVVVGSNPIAYPPIGAGEASYAWRIMIGARALDLTWTVKRGGVPRSPARWERRRS
jgi:hypothetical protein